MIRKLKNILNNKENSNLQSSLNAGGYGVHNQPQSHGPVYPSDSSIGKIYQTKSNSGSPVNYIKRSNLNLSVKVNC